MSLASKLKASRNVMNGKRARKGKRNPSRRSNPYSIEARELELFTENDRALARTFTAIYKKLINKQATGKYSKTKAIQEFKYVVEEGAKRYVKEFGGTWFKMFPPAVRKEVAAAFRDCFEAEAALGNFDYLLFKKYQR